MDTDESDDQLKRILEAALLAAGRPLSTDQLLGLFAEGERPERDELRRALDQLGEDMAGRGVELKAVASGYRMQVRPELKQWVSRLWEERPARYSRALLETLALITYRQPITRGEIEEVRGVSVSTSLIRTLVERNWIRVVGHRDVPGRPALYGTTREFLDYFNLRSLDELPPLAEIREIPASDGLDTRGGGEGGVDEAYDAGDVHAVGDGDDGAPGSDDLAVAIADSDTAAVVPADTTDVAAATAGDALTAWTPSWEDDDDPDAADVSRHERDDAGAIDGDDSDGEAGAESSNRGHG